VAENKVGLGSFVGAL